MITSSTSVPKISTNTATISSADRWRPPGRVVGCQRLVPPERVHAPSNGRRVLPQLLRRKHRR